MAIVEEYGPREVLQRLADPWWFQAFGCVLGFDWHSSGITTVTCGAIKEAARRYGDDLGILVAGGKGAASRKTPSEITVAADRLAINEGERLVYASRMSAKVDSAAVQDGFDIYHHSFFFTREGQWCVVQQGMQDKGPWARRYHWLGESVRDFVCEPHAAVQDLDDVPAASGSSALTQRAAHSARTGGDELPGSASCQPSRPARQLMLLNMVAEEAKDNRAGSVQLIQENPDWLRRELRRVTEGPTLFAPQHHPLLDLDVNLPRLRRIVATAHEQHPRDFETLLGLAGVGPATIRSLALLAELIFSAPASHRDPADKLPLVQPATRRWADYAYAHGGKDGTPYHVDRENYDRSITVLNDAVRRARLGENDKFQALKRLAEWK
jgi:hypothetical protein